MKKRILFCVCSIAVTGCTLTKTENPLSPSVAGPIPGVNITAPNPLTPRDGLLIITSQQPVTLTLANATTSGVRPIGYLFELASDAGFATKLFSIEKVTPGVDGKTSTRLPQALASGRTYYWRAKAQDGANEGPYSPAATFDIVTPVVFQAPVPTQPAGGSTVATLRPTFGWTNSTRQGTPNGPVIYDVELAENSAFTDKVSASVNEVSGGQTTAVPPQDGKPGKQYYWHVRARDSVTTGDWSATQTFNTPAAAGGGGGGGTGGGGGSVNSACHIAAGPQTVDRASAVLYGCANEFPSLLAVYGSEEQAELAAEQLLLRTIWHWKLAGFDAARQRNPSGLISKDKVNLTIGGVWVTFDVYSLGVAGRATSITGMNDICTGKPGPPDYPPCTIPIPEAGIPD